MSNGLTNSNLNLQVQVWLSNLDDNGERVEGLDLFPAIAAIVAVEHFNSRNSSIVSLNQLAGVCPNLEVKLNVFDTQFSSSKTLDTYLASVSTNDSRPDAVVGPGISDISSPLAIVTGVQNVIMIDHGASAATFSDKKTYPRFTRTIPSDLTIIQALAAYLKSLKYRFVGIIHSSDAYGTNYKEFLLRECAKLGIIVQSTQIESDSDSAESINSAVLFMKRSKLNVMVCAMISQKDFTRVIQTSFQNGLLSSEQFWIFTDTADSNLFNTFNFEIQKALIGNVQVLAVAGIPKSDPGHDRFTMNVPNFSQFKTRINELLPGGVKHGLGINSTVGQNDLPFTLQIDDDFFSSPGLTIGSFERYMYDAAMTACIAACYKVGSNTNTTYFQHILNTTFEGASGQVSFDEFGDRLTRRIRIRNIQQPNPNEIAFVDVGQYETTWNISLAMQYPGASSQPPKDVALPNHNQNLLQIQNLAVGYVFVTFGYLAIAICTVWVWYYWKQKIVNQSQPEFLLLFLIGNLISMTSIIFEGDDSPNDQDSYSSSSCMVFVWLYSLGFVLSFTALFAKTYRIRLLFNNRKLRHFKVRARDLFTLVFLVVAIDVALLISWTIVDPLTWTVTLLRQDAFQQPEESSGQCTSDGALFVYLVLGYHLLVLFVGNYISYSVRHVPSSFQESRWISFSMLCTLQLFIVGIPTLAAVYNSPLIRYYLIASIICMNSLTIVGLIFVPKMYAQFYALVDADEQKRYSNSSKQAAKLHQPLPKNSSSSRRHSGNSSYGKDISTGKDQQNSNVVPKTPSDLGLQQSPYMMQSTFVEPAQQKQLPQTNAAIYKGNTSVELA